MVNLSSITIGMNRFFGVLIFFSFSGCMALAPKPQYPANLVEDDLIGRWEYYQGKSITVVDSKDNNTEYKDARLILVLNLDHSYEEILI